MKSKMALIILAAVMALPVFADVADDAIQLAQKGVNEQIIEAWAQRQAGVSLTSQDILRMKEANVSEAVIGILSQNGATAQSQTQSIYTPDATASTTYVQPSTTYVYDSYPSSYGYYGGGYPYYRGYGTGVGLNFNFGGGHSYSGRGNYGGGYSHGFSGGYSSRGFGGGHRR